MGISFQVTFDCADPDRLATFWAEALGYKKQDPPPGFASWQDFLKSQNVPESEWNSRSAIIDPEGKGSRIFFQRVPEPKASKNRVHLDVNVGGGGRNVQAEERKRRVQEAIERLVALGATKVQDFEVWGDSWTVMTDPEGNEFCLQ